MGKTKVEFSVDTVSDSKSNLNMDLNGSLKKKRSVYRNRL